MCKRLTFSFFTGRCNRTSGESAKSSVFYKKLEHSPEMLNVQKKYCIHFCCRMHWRFFSSAWIAMLRLNSIVNAKRWNELLSHLFVLRQFSLAFGAKLILIINNTKGNVNKFHKNIALRHLNAKKGWKYICLWERWMNLETVPMWCLNVVPMNERIDTVFHLSVDT